MATNQATCDECGAVKSGKEITRSIVRTKHSVVCVDCYNSRYNYMIDEST